MVVIGDDGDVEGSELVVSAATEMKFPLTEVAAVVVVNGSNDSTPTPRFLLALAPSPPIIVIDVGS